MLYPPWSTLLGAAMPEKGFWEGGGMGAAAEQSSSQPWQDVWRCRFPESMGWPRCQGERQAELNSCHESSCILRQLPLC